eukprot:6756961-Karenia_brevis.AAC.1
MLPLEEYCVDGIETGIPCAMMKDVLSKVRVKDLLGSLHVAFDLLCSLKVDSIWAIPLTCADYDRVGQGGDLLRRIGLGRRVPWADLVPRQPMRKLVMKFLKSNNPGAEARDARADP